MRACGIEIKGNEAILIILEKNNDTFQVIETTIKKIQLENDESKSTIFDFFNILSLFFKENQINKIAVKKRFKKGEFQGGVVGFKIEAIIQTCNNIPVEIVAPISIKKTFQKDGIEIPNEIYKYQYEAFMTAYWMLKNG